MQKFWILGTETFAWNSSHRRGSGPQTQTQTVDSFRIGLGRQKVQIVIGHKILLFGGYLFWL